MEPDSDLNLDLDKKSKRRPKNMWIWWIRISNSGYKILAFCATGLVLNQSPASQVTGD
jgi:hypothetical protein